MSSAKVRRAEDIENFKNAVLDTAILLMREEHDWGMVSVNKIATILRYTPPNIYHYFENKDDILFQLGQRGLKILGAKLQHIASQEFESKKIKLFQIGIQFWEFSIENEELYDLMYHTRQKKIDKGLLLGNIETIKKVIHEVNPSLEKNKDTYKLHQGFHCLIHGFISLKINNRIPIDDHNYFKTLFEETLKNYIEQI